MSCLKFPFIPATLQNSESNFFTTQCHRRSRLNEKLGHYEKTFVQDSESLEAEKIEITISQGCFNITYSRRKEQKCEWLPQNVFSLHTRHTLISWKGKWRCGCAVSGIYFNDIRVDSWWDKDVYGSGNTKIFHRENILRCI